MSVSAKSGLMLDGGSDSLRIAERFAALMGVNERPLRGADSVAVSDREGRRPVAGGLLPYGCFLLWAPQRRQLPNHPSPPFWPGLGKGKSEPTGLALLAPPFIRSSRQDGGKRTLGDRCCDDRETNCARALFASTETG